jgi:mono/diheme cytochrome c family protein
MDRARAMRNPKRGPASAALPPLAAVLLAGLLSGPEARAQQAPAMAAAAASAQHQLIEENCGRCHNSTDWAGGLAFDTLTLDNLGSDAEVWEATVRKLRGHLMPPPGEPRPEGKRLEELVHWLETRLDEAAAKRPDPGYVGLHRLNRTEYAREIRRLLDIDVDAATLLPKDVSSEGFDNVAATLRISPAFLDQYITAARLVSRQAIGRTTAKPSTHEYRIDTYVDQDRHIDGLPLGTRGGAVVVHDFPADGEYVFNIRDFFFMGAGYVTKIDDPHTVVLTIDDVRVFQQSVGGPEDQKYVDQEQAIAADEMQARFNGIRVKVRAGEHRVGVAFIARSMAQSDSWLQPVAMLPEMERVPRIPGVEISGPFNVTGLSETPGRRRIFTCRPATTADEEPCALSILSRLAAEAYRRPITTADLEAPMAFYRHGRESGDFEAGVESGLTAILASTKFLLRSTAGGEGTLQAGVEDLTDLELATRLSFFIWSEGPDEQLVKLATAGRLREPGVLEAQVSRMIKDPRSDSLVTNFAFQWLNVGRMDSILPDPSLYPDFDTNLRRGYREELRLFLDSVLRSDRSVLELLSSETTFLNERVARQYGVPNVSGDQFRPVRLADPNRHGLFGKGALLMATSYGNRTSPVLRGSWILEAINGTPPTAPPLGVEQFPETEAGRKVLTVRERLEMHRETPSCNSCHGVIDPLGFALENFDVTGTWRARDVDAGTKIDASGQLASGRHVDGPAELSRALLETPDQFVHAIAEKLMVYALARPVRYQDMPALRAIVRDAAKDDYRFEALVRGIATSDAFRKRLPPAPEGPAVTTAAAR